MRQTRHRFSRREWAVGEPPPLRQTRPVWFWWLYTRTTDAPRTGVRASSEYIRASSTTASNCCRRRVPVAGTGAGAAIAIVVVGAAAAETSFLQTAPRGSPGALRRSRPRPGRAHTAAAPPTWLFRPPGRPRPLRPRRRHWNRQAAASFWRSRAPWALPRILEKWAKEESMEWPPNQATTATGVSKTVPSLCRHLIRI